MGADSISKIRRLVEQAKQSGGSRAHYSEAVKSEVAALFRTGMKTKEIAIATGLCVSTIFKWVRRSKRSTGPGEKVFRSLKLEKKQKTISSEIKVRLPSGITIECSSDSSLKKILELIK